MAWPKKSIFLWTCMYAITFIISRFYGNHLFVFVICCASYILLLVIDIYHYKRLQSTQTLFLLSIIANFCFTTNIVGYFQCMCPDSFLDQPDDTSLCDIQWRFNIAVYRTGGLVGLSGAYRASNIPYIEATLHFGTMILVWTIIQPINNHFNRLDNYKAYDIGCPKQSLVSCFCIIFVLKWLLFLGLVYVILILVECLYQVKNLNLNGLNINSIYVIFKYIALILTCFNDSILVFITLIRKQIRLSVFFVFFCRNEFCICLNNRDILCTIWLAQLVSDCFYV